MSSRYDDLHSQLNRIARHKFPYIESEISKNGIYVMFEEGETYKTFSRIVRLGSHTGANRLFERIDEHYIGNDHRDSIFRKHLGRCFLTVDGKEDYIDKWDLKIKKKEDKAKNISKIDFQLEKRYEEQITEHIQKSFSFVIIPGLTDETKRLRLEEGLIATLAQAPGRMSSNHWLGNLHPDDRIRNSKLWNIQHLSDPPLTDDETAEILQKIG